MPVLRYHNLIRKAASDSIIKTGIDIFSRLFRVIALVITRNNRLKAAISLAKCQVYFLAN